MYDVLASYYDLIHEQLQEDLDFVLGSSRQKCRSYLGVRLWDGPFAAAFDQRWV